MGFFFKTSPAPPPSLDLQDTLALSLEEAVTGCERAFTRRAPCEACDGTGSVGDRTCARCGGDRIEAEALRLTLPAGIDAGHTLRLQGKGRRRGEARGDLYLTVEVAAHDAFSREERDLFCRVRVLPEQLREGGAVRVERFREALTVAIPPGTRSGTTLRCAGKGVPALDGSGVGDLYVTVVAA